MSAADLQAGATADLTTPLLADACVRLGVEVRTAPPGLVPIVPCPLVLGPARPVRHLGSVDAFLEAIDASRPGEVLVIDDGGRRDRGCAGDLTALEAQAAGLAAIVVWGAHRDGADLRRIGLPVFSLGSMPPGPLGLDAAEDGAVRIGPHAVSTEDAIAGDEDGVLLLPRARLDELVAAAHDIALRERRQARRVREGTSLREQLKFADYLAARAADPSVTFRAHLRDLGGAIEE